MTSHKLQQNQLQGHNTHTMTSLHKIISREQETAPSPPFSGDELGKILSYIWIKKYLKICKYYLLLKESLHSNLRIHISHLYISYCHDYGYYRLFLHTTVCYSFCICEVALVSLQC